MMTATSVNDNRDGWDDEWGSLEEEPANEELEEKLNHDLNHLTASRSNSNSNSHSSSNNNKNGSEGPGETLLNSSSNSNTNSNWDNYGTTWNQDDEFEPIDDNGGEFECKFRFALSLMFVHSFSKFKV